MGGRLTGWWCDGKERGTARWSYQIRQLVIDSPNLEIVFVLET